MSSPEKERRFLFCFYSWAEVCVTIAKKVGSKEHGERGTMINPDKCDVWLLTLCSLESEVKELRRVRSFPENTRAKSPLFHPPSGLLSAWPDLLISSSSKTGVEGFRETALTTHYTFTPLSTLPKLTAARRNSLEAQSNSQGWPQDATKKQVISGQCRRAKATAG